MLACSLALLLVCGCAADGEPASGDEQGTSSMTAGRSSGGQQTTGDATGAQGASGTIDDAAQSGDADAVQQDAADEPVAPSAYAAPGSEAAVPGPSARILQPDSGVRGLAPDPAGWLYLLTQAGLSRVATPIEGAPAIEQLDVGRLEGPWFDATHLYWVDLDRWVVLRWEKRAEPRSPEQIADEAEEFPVPLTPGGGGITFDLRGLLHQGALYLARDGCASVGKLDGEGKASGPLSPWAPGVEASGLPSLAAVGARVYCQGSAFRERRLFEVDAAVASAQTVWMHVDEDVQSRMPVSPIAAAGGRIYWIVTPGLRPTPAELHAHDPESGSASLVRELETQVAERVRTDRDDRLYWRAVDGAGRELLRVHHLESGQTTDHHADFGLVYTDAAGDQRVTHLLDFALSSDHVYWHRGNPGSRVGDPGDDVMRLPRETLDAP